jgi:putative FmdB family regulatory protein
MPIYEFVCEGCAHEFERIVSFTAAIAPTCPACEGDSVKRLMSKPAIHFKGSGWYITDSKADHKKSNGNGANGSEKSNDGESTKSNDGESAKSASDETTVASESPKGESVKAADGVKGDNVKTDSAKTEGVKSDGATKSAVKADG